MGEEPGFGKGFVRNTSAAGLAKSVDHEHTKPGRIYLGVVLEVEKFE